MIETTPHGNTTILSVDGRLDVTTGPELEKHATALVQDGVRRMIVDLGRADYISSAGLRALLITARRLQMADGKLVLAAASNQARKVLDVAGFAAVIPVFDSTEEALSAFGPSTEHTVAQTAPLREGPLSFAEEIYLLALDDAKGAVKAIAGAALDYALAGALLMELAIRDRIDTAPEGLKVVSAAPTGDDLLDSVLERMNTTTDPQTPGWWLAELADPAAELQARVLERLLQKGVLKQVDQKILWVFAVRRYPMIDDREVKEVRARLRELLLGDEIPDPRDVVLVNLGNTCRLLDDLFTPEEMERVEPRMEALARLDLIGQDTTRAVREIERTTAEAMSMAMPMSMGMGGMGTGLM
jgi:anti-anti-sigma factor